MTDADAQVRAFLEEVGRKRGMPSFFDRFVFHHYILFDHVDVVVPDILEWLEEICG